MTRATRTGPTLCLAALALAACAVGPNYVRPAVATPPAFKEAEGWTRAAPADGAVRGDWWSVFGDPVLDRLENEIEVSNQNLAAAEAAYRQARALVAQDRASLFPTVSLNGAATTSQRNGGGFIVTPGGSGGGVATGGGRSTSYQLGGQASWEPDLWGRIRRTIELAHASAQASAADLANALLSAQSQLAVDYIQLRADDEVIRLTDQTVEGYKQALQIAQNRYRAGMAVQSDVFNAQTQLANAEAQALATAQQRTQLEHAIAVLAGRPPAELTIAPTAFTLTTPDVPVVVPSVLLQRRPDIAAAERQAASANAQIGVQEAAYFPTLSLTGQGGVAADSLASLFSASASFWSFGANVAETLIDFGARKAKVAQARAAWDQAVAQYRQTVLSAFQEVEDALAAGRVLADEQPLRVQASRAADGAERIALNQYKAGTADYTTVVVAQASALSARQALVTTESNRMVAAVDLITAMGGGWSAAAPAPPSARPPPAAVGG